MGSFSHLKELCLGRSPGKALNLVETIAILVSCKILHLNFLDLLSLPDDMGSYIHSMANYTEHNTTVITDKSVSCSWDTYI